MNTKAFRPSIGAASEKRIRVTLHLPVKGGARSKAFKKFVDYLHKKWCSKDYVGGWTMSDPGNPIFTGYWLSKTGSRPEEDHISVIFFDYFETYVGKRPTIDEVTEEIGKKAHTIYAEDESAYQHVIWITHHTVHVTKIGPVQIGHPS